MAKTRPENGEKTTIGLISKKATLHVQHTFLYISLPLPFRNLFMEEISYVFSFTFFFTAAHFLLALVAASISHFLFAAVKFSCCSSNKKCLLCFFISRSSSRSLYFLAEFCWPVALFLFLHIPNLWT